MAHVEGTNWAGHDLELLQLLANVARCLLGLVVWYECPVATFGGFSCSKWYCMVGWATSYPSLPSPSSTFPPPHSEISAHQKNGLKNLEIQPSAIHKVNYTKSKGLLCLLLLMHDGQLQAAFVLINFDILKWIITLSDSFHDHCTYLKFITCITYIYKYTVNCTYIPYVYTYSAVFLPYVIEYLIYICNLTSENWPSSHLVMF